jgi:hypothetical protein
VAEAGPFDVCVTDARDGSPIDNAFDFTAVEISLRPPGSAGLAAILLLASFLPLAAPAMADDPGRIAVYVTPFYNSTGPVVNVGKFSAGLASKNQDRFVATILAMRKEWPHLSFLELYAGAIRLYDLGYRNEATYWFYSAQYQGRLFALLVDRRKMGGTGDRGFELYHAEESFFTLAGPDINGYAFGNVDSLVTIVRRVQRENQSLPDIAAIYPGVAFTNKSQWQAENAGLGAGLGKLAVTLAAQKSSIAQQRAQNGTGWRFSQLTSKPFPGGF